MKVAMLDPSAFTPPYDHHLCEGLSETKCRVDLLTTNFDYVEWESDLSYNKREFFYRWTNKISAMSTSGRHLKLLKGCEHFYDSVRLLRQLRKINPDIIHFQWLALPVVDKLFLDQLRKVAPLVHTVHESKPYHGSAPSLIQQLNAESIPDQFDHLIVHTEDAKADLIERGISQSKISVIPHGILEYSTDDGVQLNSSEYPPNNENVVLLFGGLREYKGVDILLKAFSQLSETIQEDTRLKIAGSASISVEELQNLATDLGISSQIDWDIRYIPDEEVPELLHEADVFVFPYRTANQSGALMTVLPYGKPIVASDVGGFSKVLEDGTHGRLVEPEDPNDLAQALEEILVKKSKRKVMGSAVRSLAETVYSWDNIANETVRVYNQTIRNSGGQSRQ
jgi:glycosyltransferase involved in cell wall biosynthesis